MPFLLLPIFFLDGVQGLFDMSLRLLQATILGAWVGKREYLEFFCARFGVDDFVDGVEGGKGSLDIRRTHKCLRM